MAPVRVQTCRVHLGERGVDTTTLANDLIASTRVFTGNMETLSNSQLLERIYQMLWARAASLSELNTLSAS